MHDFVICTITCTTEMLWYLKCRAMFNGKMIEWDGRFDDWWNKHKPEMMDNCIKPILNLTNDLSVLNAGKCINPKNTSFFPFNMILSLSISFISFHKHKFWHLKTFKKEFSKLKICLIIYSDKSEIKCIDAVKICKLIS